MAEFQPASSSIGKMEQTHKTDRLKRLFGYKVYIGDRSSLIQELDARIDKRIATTIVSLNTLKLYQGSKDPELERVFQSADYIIPDGQSIVLAEKLINGISIKAISGAELMVELIRLAETKGYRLFFLGAPDELLKRVSEKIRADHPGLKDKVAFQHGYYDQATEEETVVQKIETFAPDILFVAFGSPRKEEFIIQNQSRLGTVNMGVGGSYEYFVGDVKLDGLSKRLGLRWLLRTLQDPKRLAKRYAVCNTYFLKLLLLEIIRPKRSN